MHGWGPGSVALLNFLGGAIAIVARCVAQEPVVVRLRLPELAGALVRLGQIEQGLRICVLLVGGGERLARRFLGRPTPNTVLLGALTALTEVIHLESVHAAIRDKFAGEVARRNVEAASAAHEQALPA